MPRGWIWSLAVSHPGKFISLEVTKGILYLPHSREKKGGGYVLLYIILNSTTEPVLVDKMEANPYRCVLLYSMWHEGNWNMTYFSGILWEKRKKRMRLFIFSHILLGNVIWWSLAEVLWQTSGVVSHWCLYPLQCYLWY